MEEPEQALSGKVRSGKARMEKLSREERHDFAQKGAMARWEKSRNQSVSENTSTDAPREDGGVPIARYPGVLTLNGVDIPVYVLSNGQHVISRVVIITIFFIKVPYFYSTVDFKRMNGCEQKWLRIR
jgi:hypothetical protein